MRSLQENTYLTLRRKLLKNLCSIGIETAGINLVLRPFSKTLYGYFIPDKIVLYVFKDNRCSVLYPFDKLFRNLLHEYVHREQYFDPMWVRVKGVMHDTDFYNRLKHYTDIWNSKEVV